MKKRLLCGLVIAISVVGLALVSSCKDYDDYADLKVTGRTEHQSLRDSMRRNWDSIQVALDSIHAAQEDIDTLYARLGRVKTCTVNCDSLRKEVDTIYMMLDSLKGDSGTILGQFNYLIKKLENTTNKADSAKDSIDSIADVLAEMKHVLDSLKELNLVVPEQYDTVPLFEAVDTLNQKIDSLYLIYGILSDKIDTVDSVLQSKIDTIRDNRKMIDSILNVIIPEIYDRFDSIDSVLNLHSLRIDTLVSRVDSLYDAEKKRITSLYIQGTVNPTFGSFALPMGIRSNILSCYYGTSTENGEFPATEAGNNGAVLEPGMELTMAELGAIGGAPASLTTITSGKTIISDSAYNAGRIFVTINPNQVDITDDYKFTLLNSQGDTVPVVIDTLKPSTEKLTFGWTRATSPTGFFEAGVKIEEANVKALTPEYGVSKEQLKNIAKDVLSYSDGINLAGIAGAVFKLAQTSLDANALSVEWTDSLGTHTVTSQYDVAVAAIEPLSYETGKGIGTSRRLPTISPLTELSITTPSFTPINLNDITFTIDGKSAHISFDSVHISKAGVVSVTVNVPETVNLTTGEVATTKTETYNVAGLNDILEDVENGFNTSVVAWGPEVNKSIDTIMSKIQKQVEDLIKKQMPGKLNNSIQSMLNEVSGSINSSISGYNSYFDKMNSLISRINSVTNRINSKLSLDVNAILQPVLFYESNGSLHPMSNDPEHPSIFVKGGGGIVLYPTSYTAELLAPAYQKFIAVVNGPAGSLTDLNSAEYMNQVIDGNRYAIPFAPTDPGKYTIYYSAVDYHGVVSAQRFYVTVVE